MRWKVFSHMPPKDIHGGEANRIGFESILLLPPARSIKKEELYFDNIPDNGEGEMYKICEEKKDENDKHTVATKLQAIQRRKSAMKEVEKIKEQKKEEESHIAATRLQALQVSTSVLELRRAMPLYQCYTT